jgi:hypothetical protein
MLPPEKPIQSRADIVRWFRALSSATIGAWRN